jgi:hypothetical protein
VAGGELKRISAIRAIGAGRLIVASDTHFCGVSSIRAFPHFPLSP